MAHILMRSVSGVRGIVGEGLTPPVLASHVHAFVQAVGKGKVLVGRDTRDSGPLVEQVVCATLAMSGCTAVRLGVATTPTVEMAVQADPDAVGGIILTASHNPAPWNALKFLDKDGLFLGPDAVKALFARVDAHEETWVRHDGLGAVVDGPDSDDLHIDAILALPYLDLDAIRRRKLTIAVDAVNGAAYRIAPRLLERLGCKVVAIHVTPDGRFPRGAEPVPEALADLGRAVRDHGCDAGLAFDPDGDRLALVDEKGTPLGEEATLALAVKLILEKKKGGVALNLSTSAMSEDIAKAMGVSCVRTSVGEIHVSTRMLADGLLIGGEGNGGVILPELHPGRDGVLGAALVCQLLTDGRKLSEHAAALPRYSMVKTKFDLAGKDLTASIAKLKTKFADAALDERDGLRLSWPDRWVHLRASNTEPILRAIAEAPTAPEAQALCDAAKETL
jgi:phosphomannomutase